MDKNKRIARTLIIINLKDILYSAKINDEMRLKRYQNRALGTISTLYTLDLIDNDTHFRLVKLIYNIQGNYYKGRIK